MNPIERITLEAVGLAEKRRPVLVRCYSQQDADAIFSSIVQLTKLKTPLIFHRERAIWFEPGGRGGWIRIRYCGQESPGPHITVLDIKEMK